MDLPVPALAVQDAAVDIHPFHAVFIRAPLIESVFPTVEILADLTDGTIVAARQGNLLVTSFHPELTGDTRFHQLFVAGCSAPVSVARSGAAGA